MAIERAGVELRIEHNRDQQSAVSGLRSGGCARAARQSGLRIVSRIRYDVGNPQFVQDPVPIVRSGRPQRLTLLPTPAATYVKLGCSMCIGRFNCPDQLAFVLT
ncbi:MAG TPA: hypothetical protein VFV34_04980 [Blastocatellia bacterium]|nr:hypothetical protein [Blastocatellia bacterium]